MIFLLVGQAPPLPSSLLSLPSFPISLLISSPSLRSRSPILFLPFLSYPFLSNFALLHPLLYPLPFPPFPLEVGP